ncbi:MAG: hypothetical protein K8S97_05455 [Anaerolineae bacterium]|nr:hypothetical protein [Anaerolineae bacterium]
MPQLPEHPSADQSAFDNDSDITPTEYRIVRKSSRYNITGPQGRVFSKYKSASVVGPRWEELTHTPWPHKSSAYESGLRLWELGLIPREQVGQTALQPRLLPIAAPRKKSAAQPPAPVESTPAATPPKAASAAQSQSASAIKRTIRLEHPPLGLPVPRIDLARQTALIESLRKNPRLLFNDDIRVALQQEIEYHRPYARWAEKLLKILARYDTQQRMREPESPMQQNTILARHIAWQEQQLQHTEAKRT